MTRSRMGEYLEPVAPCHRHQRDAGRLRYADRERRRHRDRGQQPDPGACRLLDQLHRHAAGQQQDAARRILPLAQQGAGQLVQRVVPPDILAHCQQPPTPEAGRMDRPRLVVQHLRRLQAGYCLGHLRRGPPPPGPHARGRPHGIGQAVHAAQPASGRPRDVAAAALQRHHPLGRDPHAQLDAERGRDHVQLLDLAGLVDNALGAAEPGGEILQVLWRGHHDRMGGPVVGERNRHLLRHRPAAGFGAVPPHRDADRGRPYAGLPGSGCACGNRQIIRLQQMPNPTSPSRRS